MKQALERLETADGTHIAGHMSGFPDRAPDFPVHSAVDALRFELVPAGGGGVTTGGVEPAAFPRGPTAARPPSVASGTAATSSATVGAKRRHPNATARTSCDDGLSPAPSASRLRTTAADGPTADANSDSDLEAP